MSLARPITIVCALCACVSTAVADSAAAERQYRIARRLVAEGSTGAAASLEKVVELDADGPLADDALLDLALLEGIARWPEQLGRVEPAAAARARVHLRRILDTLPAADRRSEATLLVTLLDLEPSGSSDPAAARIALLELASGADETSASPSAARYLLGWLAWRDGDAEAARRAYQRLVIDAPGTDAARRAGRGLGALSLAGGDYGAAAARLQRAVEDGLAGAVPHRELAVRSLLRASGLGGSWNAGAAIERPTGMRRVGAAAMSAAGMLALAERREPAVLLFDVGSATPRRVALPDVTALAADRTGGLYAAAADAVHRIDRTGGARRIAGLGEFASPSALAVEDGGRVWVADRKGTRVASIAPGGASAVPAWESRDARVAGLAVSAAGVPLVLDGRNGRVLALQDARAPREIAGGLGRPAAFAVDAGGSMVLLDTRGDAVVVLAADGREIDRASLESLGVRKPAATLALAADGGLILVDDGREVWRAVP